MTLFINACVRQKSRTKELADCLLSKSDHPYEEVRLDIEAAKISTMEKGYREHYSAYYGMVHKIAQNVAEQIIKLSERRCDEDKIFQKEYENALYESKRIIAVFNEEPLPERKVPSEEANDNNEEGFKFNKHYII